MKVYGFRSWGAKSGKYSGENRIKKGFAVGVGCVGEEGWFWGSWCGKKGCSRERLGNWGVGVGSWGESGGFYENGNKVEFG